VGVQPYGGMLTGYGSIAARFGYTVKQVRKAIHDIKQGQPGNPNFGFDRNTGDVYVQLPGGGYGDAPIGNIGDTIENGTGNHTSNVSALARLGIAAGIVIFVAPKIAGIVGAPFTGGSSLVLELA